MAKRTTPDLSGQKFGRYLVLRKDENKCDKRGRYDFYICKCDCGNIRSVNKWRLIRGTSRSCGCRTSERMKTSDYKHGYSRTRLYHILQLMKYRCYNPKSSDYCNYGGRGIRICDDWIANPMTFIDWALSHGYDETYSIDRIDVNGNYEPNNCRWATRKTQQRNRRDAFKIVFNGVERSFADVCDETGVKRANAWQIWLKYRDESILVDYIKSHAVPAS